VESTALSLPGVVFSDKLGPRSQFLITAYQDPLPLTKLSMLKPSSPLITSQESLTSPGRVLNLSWPPLLDYREETPKTVEDVTYHIFWTDDLSANLESSCVLNADVYKANGYSTMTTRELNKNVGLIPRKEYRVNVVAVVNSGKDKGQIYPYK
jgi:hypothetical protein